ncbi:hypothetical protein YC2023_059938 [Brassica napus]
MVVSGGRNKIWLGFEDNSGRSIDGDADQCLISHTHQPDTQRAVKKRSREEPVDLSAAVGVMRSWFQNSVLFSSKLGPSLIFSGSSLKRGNEQLHSGWEAMDQLLHGVRTVTFSGEAMDQPKAWS